MALPLPQVQTAIGNQLTKTLSERLDGTISIEKIHLKPFTTLVLKNAVITDKNPSYDALDSTLHPIDTFFRAEYIIAKFSLDGLTDKESIRIRSAYIGNAQMNLVLEDLVLNDGSIDNYDNLSRIFRIKEPEVKKKPSPKEIFRIGNVEISEMGFALINRSSEKTPYYGGINWNDLDIKDINLSARNLRFKNGIMSGLAESLSFVEKSGFTCGRISGEARVGQGKTIIDDLRIRDSYSDIHLPLFMMSYNGVQDFSDFIHKVRLDASILNSIVDFRTISYFAPQLEGNRLRADISGSMSGCIDNFAIRDMRICSSAGGFEATVDGRMRGIPETYQMHIDGQLNDIRLTPEGLGLFVSEWMPEGKLDLSGFGKECVFTGNGEACGYLNSLNTRADLHTAAEA